MLALPYLGVMTKTLPSVWGHGEFIVYTSVPVYECTFAFILPILIYFILLYLPECMRDSQFYNYFYFKFLSLII